MTPAKDEKKTYLYILKKRFMGIVLSRAFHIDKTES